MEFTVERGKLWMLQTRNGKRTTKAALKNCGRHGQRGADHPRRGRSGGSTPRPSTSCCTRRSTPKAARNLVATGLPASPGAAQGEIVFTSEDAENAKGGRPQDHPGPRRDLARRHQRHARRRRHSDHAWRHDVPRGRRGAAAWASLVSRARVPSGSITKPARWPVAGVVLRQGDIITVDGSHWASAEGDASPCWSPNSRATSRLLWSWADAIRRMKVRANAETPADAEAARPLRRRRHRALPHRAHVSSTQVASSRCAR